jgi:hypothetical protein
MLVKRVSEQHAQILTSIPTPLTLLSFLPRRLNVTGELYCAQVVQSAQLEP